MGKRDVELFYKDLTISDLDENLSEMSYQCDQHANTFTNLNAQLFCCMNQATGETMSTPELDKFEIQFWRPAHCDQEERF